jgi:spermidine synthase
MLRSEVLDRVRTPDGEELILHRRGDVYTLRLGGWELMSSRAHGSEQALAERPLAQLEGPGRREPRVLVGGLGMGFTLRALLDALPVSRGEVVVAEVFPAVVAWNRGPLAHLAREPLNDPRVTVLEEDVRAVIARSRGRFDLVLLDVDNGPEALTLASNQRLYGPAGLAAIRRALVRGGVLAVWSADPAPEFHKVLRQAGFGVTTETVRTHRNKGLHHTLFLAR